MEYNFGGSLKQKMYGDLTGNYYSTYHFVEINNLEHIAEELFGENWEAEDDVEQIKKIIDFIGHNKLYVVVVPSDRSEWQNLMSTYGDSLSKRVGDSNYDIFVIDSSEYKGEYEFGGKIKYTNKFKSVGTIGSDEFYIRNFGKVSTEYFDDIELLVVAKIQDLNEYISQEEIKKLGGEFQLDITLIPTEKHLSLDIVAEARENSGFNHDIISVENLMGGLNYSPEDKSIFKTFDEAEEYLMSKELNDKISADSVLSGYILDNKYNRAGQSNWDFLAYMMGEKESFWGNGGQITESDFNTNKELRIGNVKLILRKLQNPTYYRVEEYLLEGDTWEKYGSFGSRNWNDVVNEINFISENKGYEGQYEKGGGVGDFSEYSNDALTEAIINLSRYENNEELIQILKEELERRKKINKHQSSFEKGGFTSEELWDDNLTPQEELDEIVQNLDEDEYESLCYEYNIDVEDANEMVSFIYQLNDRDAIDLINRYKKENGGSIESEISKEQLENMIGRKLNGWNDDKVEYKGVLYQKCFLKPNYKKC